MNALTIGCWLAAILSYVINKSIWWAILHFLCNWFYVGYWIFKYTAFDDWICSLVVK